MISEMTPKDIFSGVYLPKRRLVELAIELKNEPGAMNKVSSEIAKVNVNILSGFHSPYDEKGHWSLFADFKDAGLTPEELVERIKKLNVVLDAKFAEARFKNLILDSLHFPLWVMDERTVALHIETLGGAFSRIFELFGTGAYLMMFEMGKEAGNNRATVVHEKYKVNGLTMLEIILAERLANGWCIPKVVKFDEKGAECIVRTYELFECLPHKGRRKEPRSHFFRGYLLGITTKLFKKDLSILEDKCIAKGDSYCEFNIKPRA